MVTNSLNMSRPESEYWIIDPVRETCLFYRLQPTGHYTPVQPDEQGTYQTRSCRV